MSENLPRDHLGQFQCLLPRPKGHAKNLKKVDPVGLNSKDGRFEFVNSYQYEPLPTREHTRVLVLESGPNNDDEQPLVGSLRLIKLRDADLSNHLFHRIRKTFAFRDHEPYEAVSYVWGPSEKTHVILVDGRPLRITASLREALLQTRLPDRPRTLWADGICINQSDKNEKGHQVAEMGRIYKTSKQTLICLGPEDPENAQHAAGLVKEANLMILDILRDPRFLRKPGSFPYPAENDTIVHDSRWGTGWNMMLSHPWFRRGWVVQEASLGPDACVLWASVQIRWSSILRVDYWLYNRGYLALRSQGRERLEGLVSHHYCSFARRQSEEVRLRLFAEEPRAWSSTLTTLFDARRLELSDPRDRIYAFMALDTSDGILAGLQLDPDYKQPFLKIYHEFAVKYTEKKEDLDILSFIKHDKESLAGPTTAEATPSWVPRWDLLRRCRAPIRRKMGDQPRTFKFTEHGSVLGVRGLILGSVNYNATQQPYCRPTQRGLALQKVISLWSEVVTASSMTEGPYNGREAFAFLDVLCPIQTAATFEEWSTWRQEFARYLQSFIPGSERNSATSISQRSELRTQQHSLKEFAEGVRFRGPRRFVLLSRGYYGTAPPVTHKGDLFALIYGCDTLSILRPAEDRPGYYQIIGPVYVESKTVKHSDESNQMGEEGCRDWEEWDLEEQDINLC